MSESAKAVPQQKKKFKRNRADLFNPDGTLKPMTLQDLEKRYGAELDARGDMPPEERYGPDHWRNRLTNEQQDVSCLCVPLYVAYHHSCFIRCWHSSKKDNPCMHTQCLCDSCMHLTLMHVCGVTHVFALRVC